MLIYHNSFILIVKQKAIYQDAIMSSQFVNHQKIFFKKNKQITVCPVYAYVYGTTQMQLHSRERVQTKPSKGC